MEYIVLLIIVVLSMATCIYGNINVAILKHTYGSSGNQHRYVNDKDPSTCFTTNPSTGTYTLAVDLADNFNLSSIVIIDGNSCCGTRLVNYTIEVEFSCKLNPITFSTCIRVCASNFWSIPNNENHLITCNRCLGNTVIIHSNQPLVLCEVQIYGTPIASYPSNYRIDPAGGCVVTNAIDPSLLPTTTLTESTVATTSHVSFTTSETPNLTDEITTYAATEASSSSTSETTSHVTSTTSSTTDETQRRPHHHTSTTVSTTGGPSTVETVTDSSKKARDPTQATDTTSTPVSTLDRTTMTSSDTYDNHSSLNQQQTTDSNDNKNPLQLKQTTDSNIMLPKKSVTVPTKFSKASAEQSKMTIVVTDVTTKDSETTTTENRSTTPFLVYHNSSPSPTFNSSRLNPVTDPPFPSYTYDLPTDNPLCACGCQSVYANISEIDAVLTKIRQNLTLDTATLSSTRRQKTSAEDNRPSAVSVGMFGVVMLTIFFVVLVIQDFISAIYFIVMYLRTAMRRVESI